MCSVAECDSWRRSAQRFKLPDDPERRLEWVQFLFEANSQRLKESSWTDISICSEHFTDGCLVKLSDTVKLRPSAVPSVRIKSEPEELELCQEPVETTEVSSHFCKLEPCSSPSSYSDESGLTSVAGQKSPVPSDTSDAFMSDFGQMLQKVANIDLIREKAGRLHMKGKYIVNEKRLLQLFRVKCPLCCSKLKVEKFTYGVLIILNQQCLQCEYRNQWKSQINASVPKAEDQHPTGGIDVTPEIQQRLSTDDENNSTITGVSEVVAFINDESDPMDEDHELGHEGDTDSDEDWTPMDELVRDNDLRSDESDEESESEDYDDDPLSPQQSELCTDCGKFFHKLKPHTCEHIVKPYSCNICGKRCVSEVALNSHSRVHDENYEHRCKYCCVTFKTKVDKIKHEQSHIAEEKPYKCPDCSETFATNEERRTHLLDHSGSSQKRCHICGIEFYRSINLRRHLAVHTGVKAFKCSVCQRCFNQASHLKSHMRLHTGERPYKCQHCDKSFNHNVSLKSHVQHCHTTNSGCEQKSKTNTTVSDTVEDQENGNKKGTDLGLDNGKEERERKERPKRKRKSTGRPLGRPKRNAVGNLVQAEEMQSQCSNTKTAKVKVQTSKTTECGDEENEGELIESDISFHSAEEEEERSEKMTLRTSRLRGRAKKSDDDSDFDPEDSKKKRYKSQNRGMVSRKSLGRSKKSQDT